MSKKLCMTCEYWRRYRHKVALENHGNHAGTCDSGKLEYNEDGRPQIDGLSYWDAEAYSADFNTGERFGCIHWKEKEKDAN